MRGKKRKKHQKKQKRNKISGVLKHFQIIYSVNVIQQQIDHLYKTKSTLSMVISKRNNSTNVISIKL